jgi:hypothetical protein
LARDRIILMLARDRIILMLARDRIILMLARDSRTRTSGSALRVGPGGIDVIGEIHTTEPVLRTVRIGDVIYAVGDNGVTAYRLSDLSEIGSTAAAPAVV